MILGKHGQYLPLNPPYADRTTVGGIAATGSSGPLRLRHGTPRSRILGMRVVQSGGDLVQSGGKVVKNVAGYDLNKLYIGSFGTLGIITDLTPGTSRSIGTSVTSRVLSRSLGTQ